MSHQQRKEMPLSLCTSDPYILSVIKALGKCGKDLLGGEGLGISGERYFSMGMARVLTDCREKPELRGTGGI
ncbi:MAG: hypothetical protein AB3K77_10715 [Methanosarcinaceae archaeon]|uniref:hypothetical protein n=1 Tax=Methanosarcina sp. MTP4 TaxID=1434100 RepID=UPI0012DFF999|nr:hypothetical protein [Methanosarcina sp. MTP4]